MSTVFHKGQFQIESRHEFTKLTKKLNYSRQFSELNDVFTAKGANGKRVQVCKGDSGGGLNVNEIQVGVTSLVDADCDKGFSAFVKIENHLKWINKAIK